MGENCLFFFVVKGNSDLDTFYWNFCKFGFVSDVNLIFVTNKEFIQSVWKCDFKKVVKINKTKNPL